MNTPELKTERLILRKFTDRDINALFLILKDEEVNTFLPWFPVKNMEEAKSFFEEKKRKNLRGTRRPRLPGHPRLSARRSAQGSRDWEASSPEKARRVAWTTRSPRQRTTVGKPRPSREAAA